MAEWIVELPGDGRRQLVDAASLHVEGGHLFALTYGGGWQADARYDTAWAPGAWVRFWPHPAQEQLDRLRVTLTICEELLARSTDDEERARLAVYLDGTRFTLEQLQDRRQAA